MRFLNTLLALILLAGLAAFIYYYEYRGEDARQSAADAGKSALTFEREKVQAIQIETVAAGKLSLSKDSTGWKIVSPLEARADTDKVEAILSSVGFLRVEQTLEAIPEAELENFKLKDPAVRVTLKMADGKDLGLNIGDKAPVGGNHYASRPGTAEVLLLSGGVEQILASDLASLRYKKVVGMDAWKVARFRIDRKEKHVAFGRASDGEDWRIESPVSFPADGSKVQALWFDLQSAEAEGFETERPAPSDLDRFGLTSPLLTLTVEAKEGAAPLRVAFGSLGPGETHYARRSDSDAVMRVPKEIVAKLDKAVSSLSDLRDARVAPVDRFKLSSLQIQRMGAPSMTLVKDDESKWHWGSKDGPEMPSEEINALIDAIEAVKATDYVEDQGAAARLEPALKLTLREGEEEGSRLVTVDVGAEGSGPGALNSARRVSNSITSAIYVVPNSTVQALVDKAASLAPPKEAAAK